MDWDPLPIDEAVGLFEKAPFRWWVAGGRALALHVGHEWRSHDDTDIGMLRSDSPALLDVLPGWDVHTATQGVLRPWSGAVPAAGCKNLWARATPGRPWGLDITLNAGDAEAFTYRRNPSLRLPWPDAVLMSPTGVPYLAPELQLLFKSKAPRPKDEVDAKTVVPLLDDERRALLAEWLDDDHPWQRLTG